MNQRHQDTIRTSVREQYGKVAESTQQGCACSSTACCGEFPADADKVSLRLGYTEQDINAIPQGANMGLGCGNPSAIASIKAGETVVDLGSGGGFDCFLASPRVGPSGRVIGVDMTPQMISKARKNADEGGYQNTEFRLGEIENLPVADNSVDVIISNCVINLSPDKQSVFNEAYRVLKQRGRLAISDIVALGEIPDAMKQDVELYAGCVSGASTVAEIKSFLANAGFQEISISPESKSSDGRSDAPGDRKVEDYIFSASIAAVKMDC